MSKSESEQSLTCGPGQCGHRPRPSEGFMSSGHPLTRDVPVEGAKRAPRVNTGPSRLPKRQNRAKLQYAARASQQVGGEER